MVSLCPSFSSVLLCMVHNVCVHTHTYTHTHTHTHTHTPFRAALQETVEGEMPHAIAAVEEDISRLQEDHSNIGERDNIEREREVMAFILGLCVVQKCRQQHQLRNLKNWR